jgi:hypothetical protein
MIHCNDIKKDYFKIKILEIQQAYFEPNYIESAKLSNALLIEISEYRYLSDEKREILSYKRLSDFQIEDKFLKTKINIY